MVRFQKELTEEFLIRGRKRRFPPAVYYIVSSMSVGIFHILCTFFPKIRLVFESYAHPQSSADLVEYNGQLYPVYKEKLGKDVVGSIAYEYIQNGAYMIVYIDHTRRIFNWVSQRYEVPEVDKYIELLTRKEKEIFFGRNEIPMPVENSLLICFNAMFNGVNVYTIFGIGLWIVIKYYVYAGLIFMLMMYTVMIEAQRALKKNKETRKLAKQTKTVFLLGSDGLGMEIRSTDVVVGDKLVLVPFLEAPCDCTVLKGTLAVDEGFVTGESVPVLKKPGAEVLGGTIVLQAMSDREDTLLTCSTIDKYVSNGNFAIVEATKTSFQSAKGKAFRNLSNQKVTRPPVYFDTIKLIGATAVLSTPFLGVIFCYLVKQGLGVFVSVCYIFDLLYAIVSPSLPTSISVGMSVCAKRLQKKKIICKDLAATNISGSIARVCFDKTGTLTEEGLAIRCINSNEQEFREVEDLPDQVRTGLQLCHSVETIEDKQLGDPLDIKLIHFSKAEITYQVTPLGRQKTITSQNQEIGSIIKLFDFDPNNRRMGVVAAIPTGYHFFCKGSPEVIEMLCHPSTLPESHQSTIDKYLIDGYRVIALAGKPLTNPNEDLPALEKDLSWLGLLVFENRLKKDTAKTISTLTTSGIESIMCTGDALLTAISVATNCSIIERHLPVIYPTIPKPTPQALTAKDLIWECKNFDDVIFDKMVLKLRKGNDYASYLDFVIAVEGQTFDLLMQSHDYRKLIEKRCKVYARMNPSQKSRVVAMYKQNELVCFVGDGANDCMAIQTADIGLSLSSDTGNAGEFCAASYVSYHPEITSILSIIKEGKCTIITTINKIEQILILTITQFIALILLQTHLLFLSDRQSIYSDIFIAIPLGIIMSRFQSSHKMTRRRPKKRLATKLIIISIFIHCFIHALHQLFIIYFMQYFGHTRTEPPFKTGHLCECSQIGTATFFIFNVQILYSGFCYTPGGPFRSSKRSNPLFIAFFLIHTILLLILLLAISDTPLARTYLIKYATNLLDLLPLSVNAIVAIATLSLTDMLLIQMLTRIIQALLHA
ncbi:cation-transporting P-type ATPase 13A2 [Nematocida homosporus]|uniref:cation-transporting P-type ATPase 13A2 n=1 Tax=Nematocida homosporus TaxID=1912981 RepID=UPI00221E61FD|nr:cation-transporting P-type ATPase 13A2 [Nematocida homosporus]KAI5185822.1 cation-transporting P-type ATPase 13A2 [Nematocida homosporus]